MGLLAPSLLLPDSGRTCPRDYPKRLVWSWRKRWRSVARTASYMLHTPASRNSCVHCIKLAICEANSDIVFLALAGNSRLRLVYSYENILWNLSTKLFYQKNFNSTDLSVSKVSSELAYLGSIKMPYSGSWIFLCCAVTKQSCVLSQRLWQGISQV